MSISHKGCVLYLKPTWAYTYKHTILRNEFISFVLATIIEPLSDPYPFKGAPHVSNEQTIIFHLDLFPLLWVQIPPIAYTDHKPIFR